MNRLRRSVFSTLRLSPPARLPAWRESIATVFDVTPVQDEDMGGFNANLTSYLLGEQVMLSHCETSAQRFERAPLRVARDGLDHYLVQTHLRGSQSVRRGRKELQCEPGDLMVIDLAEEHHAITSDFGNLSLVVPRELLAPRLLSPDSQEGRVLKGGQGLVAMGVEHLKTLWGLAPRLSPEEVGHIVAPTLALIAGILNGSTAEAADSAEVCLSPLTRAKLSIEKTLQRNLSVPELCREIKFSKAALYRLFEPYGGVRSYIQERRLRHCAEELLSPLHAGRRIYEIAFRWGFASEAHFCRTFKGKFGVSPGEARKFSRVMGPVDAERRLQEVGDRDYEQWLLENLRA